jgi:hypothetical protein
MVNFLSYKEKAALREHEEAALIARSLGTALKQSHYHGLTSPPAPRKAPKASSPPAQNSSTHRAERRRA